MEHMSSLTEGTSTSTVRWIDGVERRASVQVEFLWAYGRLA